jgi:uncharacterized protein
MKKHFLAGLVGLSMMVSTPSLKALESFPMQDVRLLSGVFLQAQETDLKYIMSMDPDRLLSPFLREAGLQPKAPSYTNWENTGLDGHIGGHYLSALSLMYASTGNKAVLDRLNYMLDELKRAQDKNGDGYIGGVPGSKTMWAEIAAGDVRGSGFGLNNKWVPLYNIHKTYAGLRDAWLIVHSEKAKEMLIRFADWMVNLTDKLTDDQIRNMLKSEHGGLNEVFADISDITGDKKYMKLAYRFSDRVLLAPLSTDVDKLDNVHANTQIPKVIGFERISELTQDTMFHHAADFFWERVVDHRSCAIGGNSVREHFNPVNNFSSMITSEQGPETCNTYNMLKLTKLLFEREGSEKYMEFYERAMFNHILSTQIPEKGGFVYFTPMRPDHYRVYSQPQTSFWCCVGSGIENHAKYNEMIYARDKGDLYVNLFVASVLNWKDKGVVVTQKTNFPEEEGTSLVLQSKKALKFTLFLRYPSWVAEGALKVFVNGKPVIFSNKPGSYVAVNRKWKDKDVVTVQTPMHTTFERLPDSSNYVAFLRGPIVLAAETDTSDMKGLFADDSRMGHSPSGKQIPLNEVPRLVSANADLVPFVKPVAGKPMTFKLPELIYQDKFKNLELIPFYKIHESRYVIYWPLDTPESIRKAEAEQARVEAEKQKLFDMTIDWIQPGEQQPESDHFIEFKDSRTGVFMDRHWRDASGWFSYRLNDKNKKAEKLRVTYSGQDRGLKFRILLNGELLTNVTLEGGRGLYQSDYAIPQALVQKSNGTLNLRFEAEPGSSVGRIFEVRLLKKD